MTLINAVHNFPCCRPISQLHHSTSKLPKSIRLYFYICRHLIRLYTFHHHHQHSSSLILLFPISLKNQGPPGGKRIYPEFIAPFPQTCPPTWQSRGPLSFYHIPVYRPRLLLNQFRPAPLGGTTPFTGSTIWLAGATFSTGAFFRSSLISATF